MGMTGSGLPDPAPSSPAITACQEGGRGKLKSPPAAKGQELCFSCFKCVWLKGSFILLNVLGEYAGLNSREDFSAEQSRKE